MSFQPGKCPLCGAIIQISDETEHCYCTSCGEAILTQAAIAFANSSADEVDDQQPYEKTVSSELSNSSELVFLDSWKTQIGPTAIGMILSVAINICTRYLSNAPDGLAFVAYLLSSIFFSLGTILYAFIAYPSFFGGNPRLRTNSVIGFLNGFFGGVIFGAIWNHNLTIRKKGVSYIVLGSLCAISVILILLFR